VDFDSEDEFDWMVTFPKIQSRYPKRFKTQESVVNMFSVTTFNLKDGKRD
jgi:hypothetical protein